MARNRTVKPEFFDDEDLAEHPFWVRILFEGLWCYADKAGRLEDRPARLQKKIFPYDKRLDFEKGLILLTQPKKHSPTHKPFIIRYSVEGENYIQIVEFLKHQSPHHTEKESVIPAPNGEITVKAPLDKGQRGDAQESESESILNILSYLNERTGKHFKKDAGGCISARISEGATFEDFKQIVDIKVPKWQGRSWEDDRNPGKMCHGDDYLRPSTLFSRKHFDEYLNERPARRGETEVGHPDPQAEAEGKRLATLYRADYDAMIIEHEKQFPDDKRFPPGFMEYARQREVKK